MVHEPTITDILSLRERLSCLDLGDMRICSECFRIYGAWRYHDGFAPIFGGSNTVTYEQVCHPDCPSRSGRHQPKHGEGTKTWEGFDFNEILAICHCCGQEILLSGSTWAFWFCPDCLAMAAAYNRERGRTIIPVGRNPKLAGLEGNCPEDRRTFETFSDEAAELSLRIEHLEKWRRLMMSENFILYLWIKTDTRLEYYLSRMKGLSKREAFHRMSLFCAGLRLPA